jgi:outer membrane lipoprotein-sorting protein
MDMIGSRQASALVAAAACALACTASAFSAETAPSSRPVFADEPAAHALYDRMIAAMREAKTLYWQSEYEWGSKDFNQRCRYEIWLKKPNYFRMEAFHDQAKSPCGILVGDGHFLWVYWPQGRPRFYPGDPDDQAYQRTRANVYMKKTTPLGMHSIGHEAVYLGTGMSMTILDPSTFHGYTDSLQAYVDGVRALPAEKIGEENCDVIEVSIMKGQRSWQLWLARSDHLPRRLKQVVRVSYDITFQENWSKVTVNGDIPDDEFTWKPPEAWQEWRSASPDEMLLKPGTQAPDFELRTADEKTVKLSQYRGQVVWLYIWRGG